MGRRPYVYGTRAYPRLEFAGQRPQQSQQQFTPTSPHIHNVEHRRTAEALIDLDGQLRKGFGVHRHMSRSGQ